jgi:hypothetical protein
MITTINVFNAMFKKAATRLGYELSVQSGLPIVKPIDTNKVEILRNKNFTAQFSMRKRHQTRRCPANIWACKVIEPAPWSGLVLGTVEVFACANACPDRPIFVFDPFSAPDRLNRRFNTRHQLCAQSIPIRLKVMCEIFFPQ